MPHPLPIRPTGLAILITFVAGMAAWAQTCDPVWHKAALTNYASYPEPGSDECLAYNGCTWAGQFYGFADKKSKDWVAAHRIVAVHSKDWDWLGMKFLKLRQDNHHLIVQVIDICADADCDGCCTENLGGDGYLIDIEAATMAEFGAGDGVVDFQICDGP